LSYVVAYTCLMTPTDTPRPSARELEALHLAEDGSLTPGYSAVDRLVYDNLERYGWTFGGCITPAGKKVLHRPV
jgi:hypothetical protein